MRILFAGTPSIAVPSLEQASRRHEVCAVLTGADQAAGRGKKLEASPVKRRAGELGLTVLEAQRINAEVTAAVRSMAPHLLVVVAFGKIFKKSFIDLFPRGGINLHPSLLPRYRGPSPIAAAVLGGDAETGVTVQRLALRFDSGDILAQERVPLSGDETTGGLSQRLGEIGAGLLCRVLEKLESAEIQGTPQNEEEATYCHLVKKEEGRIDWTESASLIERKVRAFDPWPRAATVWEGRTLLVLKSRVSLDTLGEISPPPGGADAPPGTVVGCQREQGLLVATGAGLLAVERLQLEFKKPLDWRAFLNGHPHVIGARFGG